MARKLAVLCLDVSAGESQGDPDNIEKTYYTWGMQLDTVEWEDEEGVSFCFLPVPSPGRIAVCMRRGPVPLCIALELSENAA